MRLLTKNQDFELFRRVCCTFEVDLKTGGGYELSEVILMESRASGLILD